MMIDLCNRLVDNDLSREELLPNIEITNMEYSDAPIIVELLARCFGINNEYEALRQLVYSKARLDKSVKVVDKRNGDIYGFLIFSEFPIQFGSPILHTNPRMAGFLIQFNQINGHSFILDERLRGYGIDKKMLLYNYDFVKEHELIWCAVEESLMTDNYWKRLGFKELFRIPQATFYGKFLGKYDNDNIYSIVQSIKNEEYYSK